MIKFVLLDLDDTIFDFHLAEKTALSGTLREMGIVPTDSVISRYSEINREHWQRLERGELTREQVLVNRFDALYRELGIKASAKKTQDIYEYRLSLEHPFIDGAIDMLEALHKSYKLYVVSNGTAIVQDRRISESGIGKYFDDIFISQRVGADKPDRRFFDYCAQRIDGYDPKTAIIVGDSLTSDILGGKEAGIITCHYNPKDKPYTDIAPDYTIRSLSELEGLIASL